MAERSEQPSVAPSPPDWSDIRRGLERMGASLMAAQQLSDDQERRYVIDVARGASAVNLADYWRAAQMYHRPYLEYTGPTPPTFLPAPARCAYCGLLHSAAHPVRCEGCGAPR